MTPDDLPDPLHCVLMTAAQICINETFLDEAEELHAFLQTVPVDARFLGLLGLWIQSQRGNVRDALRTCNELIETAPGSAEVNALLALLRYVCRDPTWRGVCDDLLRMPDCPPEARRIATSLLDGTFAKQKPK